jgi:ankyrin repeat protein
MGFMTTEGGGMTTMFVAPLDESPVQRRAEYWRLVKVQWELFAAAERGDSAEVEALLHWAPGLVLARGPEDRPTLHAAARGGHAAVVELLIAHGAPVHSRDRDGCTPLHLAAAGGHARAARLLLAHGADPHALDHQGRPPLYLAAREGSARTDGAADEVVELLLAHDTPLDLCTAALLGRLDSARELLDRAPERVNAPDGGGYTPLALAVWNGKLDMAKLLLERGAEMQATDERGQAPLAAAGLDGFERFGTNGLQSHSRQIRPVLCRVANCGQRWPRKRHA